MKKRSTPYKLRKNDKVLLEYDDKRYVGYITERMTRHSLLIGVIIPSQDISTSRWYMFDKIKRKLSEEEYERLRILEEL